jgi:hypothetical protein
MMRWPTLEGRSAFDVAVPESPRKAGLRKTSVKAPKRLAGRRVVSSQEYLRALEEAILVPSPFSDPGLNGMVQLASLN